MKKYIIIAVIIVALLVFYFFIGTPLVTPTTGNPITVEEQK